jgi:2-polyprenyl-3-methyl-5-hydroxy-6-metoxy-1,4-benzoquinol methylase
MHTNLSPHESRQCRYFDHPRNQYSRSALIDPPLHTAVELQRVVGELQDIAPSTRVIDFGAGTGRLSLALARAGFRVLAVDLSRSSLAVLETVARQLELHGIETATRLPADGAAAAVVGADVLHHVRLQDYLPRIHEALAPGGRIVFSEPGALNPAWYVYLPLSHGLRVEARIVTCNLPTLRRSLRRHGFRDIRITGVGILPRPLLATSVRTCQLHDAMGQWPVLRWFAYRYMITARKAQSH